MITKVVLHGVTGSVATILQPKIITSLMKRPDISQVLTILTESSKNFFEIESKLNVHYYEDSDEWIDIKKVKHIELVKRSDVFLIAPCSANTLAKIANGICDNLLTCVARAWDFNKPFIIAPSMNVNMYNHPITKQHIETLKSWGIIVVDPIEKELYCGDVGIGAMANIKDILKHI